MDALPYVDSLFKEYLLFRGFTATLQVFNKELAQDKGCGFQAERITELIFRKLIPEFQFKELMDFLDFLSARFYSRLDSKFERTIRKMETSVLRCMLVRAVRTGRADKVSEFLRQYGDLLLAGQDAAEWRPWFCLAFVKQPAKDPTFQAYFLPEWTELLEASFRNFIAEVLRSMPLPAVLRFNSDRRIRLHLQQQVDSLQQQLQSLQQQLQSLQRASASSAPASPARPEPPAPPSAAASNRPAASARLPPGDTPAAERGAAMSQTVSGLADRVVVVNGPMPPPVGDEQSGPSASEATGSVGGKGGARHPGLHLAIPSDGRVFANGEGIVRMPQPGGAAPLSPRRSVAHRRDASFGEWNGRRGSPGSSASSSGSPEHRAARKRSMSTGDVPADLLPPDIAQLLGCHADGSALDKADVTVAPASASSTPRHESTSQQAQGTPTKTSPAANLSGQSTPTSTSSQRPDAAAAESELSDTSAFTSARPSPARDLASLPAAMGLLQRTWTEGHPPDSCEGSEGTADTDSSYLLSSSPPLSQSRQLRTVGSGESASRGTFAPDSRSGSDRSSSERVAAAAAAVAAASTATAGPAPGQLQVEAAHSERYSEHSAAITCGLFSPTGQNIATASADGVVSIWSPPGLTTNSARHASLQCGSSVLCLAWDARADKVMLLGTAGRGIKAWHVDTKRMVAEIPPEGQFPDVLDLCCCPSDPAFACSLSSGLGSPGPRGRLSLWNMRAFKRNQTFAVAGDPVFSSLCYNRAGSLLGAATADGRVFVFDIGSKSQPSRSWQLPDRTPAAGTPAAGPACVRFAEAGGDTTVVSLSCQGRLQQWSLHSQRQPLRTFDLEGCEALTDGGQLVLQAGMARVPRGALALSSDGRLAAVGSRTGQVQVLDLQGDGRPCLVDSTLRSPVVTLDWHPTLDVLLCGSASGQVATLHLARSTSQ